MATTPGAGRDRPGSSTAPPGQNAKNEKAGAALDPTHHQRGCHPARRSNLSAPRQGIKTASASRKIGRESSTLSPPRMSTTPGAGRDRPGSSTAPPGQNAKNEKAGAALDPHITPSARVPSRAPVESVSPSPRDKDRERQPENRERELDIEPPANGDDARCRPRSTR